MTIHTPSESFQPADDTPLLSSRRTDGWSAAKQRLFLERIAEGFGVETACWHAGLSPQSAYAFRRTARGAAFALGWRAATLLARECIAEKLIVRALEGQVDTINRPDGSVITRHRFDNRLGMALLARLDRQVEQAPDADVQAARLVAQEFDAFLDLVERDAGPARAGLFVARRSVGGEQAGDIAPILALAAADRFLRTGVATAAEIDIADLDPAERAGWSADQWARAEAAGLLAFAGPAPDDDDAWTAQHSQHSPDDAPPRAHRVLWWHEQVGEWRTTYPPTDDFVGFESGAPGEPGYERSLSGDEQDIMERGSGMLSPAECAERARERDEFFALLAAGDESALDSAAFYFTPAYVTPPGTQPSPAGYASDTPSHGSDDHGHQAPQDDDET